MPARANTLRNMSSPWPLAASQWMPVAFAVLGSNSIPAAELASYSDAGTAESASVETPCSKLPLVCDPLAAQVSLLTTFASQGQFGVCPQPSKSTSAAADGQGNTCLNVVILFVVLVADINVQVCKLEPRAAVKDLACQDDAIPADNTRMFVSIA